jgi:acetyl esterase/lipase
MGQGGGVLGWFVNTAGRAYAGVRDWRGDRGLASMDFAGMLTADYPPAFISAGNADPLAPQSVALARRLQATGVAVETLFFPDDHGPPLGHEYQFDLDGEAGQLALERAVAWLRQLP